MRVLATHAAVGAALGTAVAFVVTSCLLEVAVNRFFAVYFGLLFLGVGLIILVRVLSSAAFALPLRVVLLCLSLVVLLAGMSCAILDHNALSLSSTARIPLFAILGSATSFALTFSIVDVLNASLKSPPVQSSMQIVAVLGSSMLAGLIYGLIFAFLDVEDAKSVALRVALMNDELISMPLGALVGGLTAVANFHLGLAPRPLSSSLGKEADFGF